MVGNDSVVYSVQVGTKGGAGGMRNQWAGHEKGTDSSISPAPLNNAPGERNAACLRGLYRKRETFGSGISTAGL